MTSSQLVGLLILAPVGLILLGLTYRWPLFGLSALAIGVPLTTGIGRGTLIPLLRPNEVLLLGVLIALALRYLVRPEPRPVNPVDIAVYTFCATGALIPFLVLFLNRTPIDFDLARSIFSPLQFLAVYLAVSSPPLDGRGIRLVLNVTMVASVMVAGLAVAEALNFSPVSNFLAAHFTSLAQAAWDTSIPRPSSTLGLYSSVGAFGLLNFALALALLTLRPPGYSHLWLVVVMIANIMGILASQTWAPAIGLVPVTIVVLLYARRIPTQLWFGLAAAGLALLLFASLVSARVSQQGVAVGSSLLIPKTMLYRMTLWQDYFVPAIDEGFWFGTGTLIPSQVPERLTNSVDNQYIRQGYRAGIVGLLLLFATLAAIVFTGWRARRHPEVIRASLGATCVAYVAALLVLGWTEEYLQYGGVGQQVALVFGLFAGCLARERVETFRPLSETRPPVGLPRVIVA
jgi:hypothetical protein